MLKKLYIILLNRLFRAQGIGHVTPTNLRLSCLRLMRLHDGGESIMRSERRGCVVYRTVMYTTPVRYIHWSFKAE